MMFMLGGETIDLDKEGLVTYELYDDVQQIVHGCDMEQSSAQNPELKQDENRDTMDLCPHLLRDVCLTY